MVKMGMNIKIWYNVPMPMRDGAILYANVYRPDNSSKYPAILNRTPYLKDGDTPLCGYIHALEIAGQGYNVVIQDVRGAGWSDGVIDPAGNQVEDGYDSVEWVAAQDWCDGNVGMVGESYHGFSQLAAAQGRPPHLKAICPFQTSWTKFPAIYSFGVFSNMLYGWIYGQAYSRMKYFPELLSRETLDKMHEYERDGDRQLRWLPLKDTPAAGIPEVPGLNFQRELLENIENSEYLKKIGRAEAFDKVEVPCLNLTGWYDFLRDKTIYNYTRFRVRGGSPSCRENSKLIVGPWNHGDVLPGIIEGVDFGPQGSGRGAGITEKLVAWFDHWLKGMDNDFVSGAPVKLFILGDNVWRDEYEWPLARTNYVSYYLHSKGRANTLDGNGTLSAEKPGEESCDQYLYDPANPCSSSTGDPHHFLIQDQRPNEHREDVLVYTTEYFEEDVEITGPFTAELFASSSAVDTDFVCKVSDVHPDGSAYSLGMQLIRARYRNGENPEFLIPGQVYQYTMEVGNIAIKLKKGHAIRLDITSSLFPDADINLNTGGRVGYESKYKVAHQCIFHTQDYPSRLILPFIPS
jgi:uncharacterized protein